jgi:hypothetical protein
MASETEGAHATAGDLLAAAAKLRNLADEMEKTGREVGGAATAAAAAMPGFRIAGASVATCGHLGSCIGDTVRQIREQADRLQASANHYTELDSAASRQVTVA